MADHSTKPDGTTVIDREPEVGDTGSMGPTGPSIRCPLCGWRPKAHDRWVCSCRHIWNTFDTGGVCPACLYQWKVTVCLHCYKLSPHSSWYQY